MGKTTFQRLIILAGLLFAGLAAGEDDLQYWSQYLFKLYSQDRTTVSLFTEARMYDDAEWLGLHLYSPRVKYKLTDHLDLQLNLTYLESRKASGDEFAYQYRIEPEINPHFKVADYLDVAFRNRMEFRRFEDDSWNHTRYRGRMRLTAPVCEKGTLRSVFTDTELFYDFVDHDHPEQRTTPIGVDLRVCTRVSLQVFYMIQNTRGSEDWQSSQIAGTTMSVDL